MDIKEEDIDNLKINDYLNGELNCKCGKKHSTKLKDVFIEENALKRIPELIKKYKFNKALIISDNNTYDVAGKKVSNILYENNMPYKEVVLKSVNNLIPDEEAVGGICIALESDIDFIITVGTGTLNDLGKFISKKVNIPSIIVATAPSMDGFVSSGSALMVKGLKVSYNSSVPIAVIGDVNIIREAPMDMILAGFGDIVGKYSALNDWKIGKIVNKEYYCDVSYKMVQKSMKICIENAEKIKNRENEAIKNLMEALIITGIAMSFVKNSRPASGSEHHLAHYFEMKFLFEKREPIFHGTKVGVLTIVTCKLRNMLKNYNIDFDKAISKANSFDLNTWEDKINYIFKDAAREIIEINKKEKTICVEDRIKRIESIKKNINEIRKVLDESPNDFEIENLLKNIGAPYKISQININNNEIVDAICFSKEIRTRYTILTLLNDLGILEDFAMEVQKEISERGNFKDV